MFSRLDISRCLLLVLLLFGSIHLTAISATAQAQPTASPVASPTPSLERRFLKNLIRDQKAIWTAPLHLRRADARWFAPLGLSTAALIATDQETDEFGFSRRRSSISKKVSLPGNAYSTAGVATAFYFVGRATGNKRARETGLLGGEALINTGIVVAALKNVTQRQRPDHDQGQGEFFEGGHSFPSGHAASAWALATVIANEYRHRPLIQVAAYGLATAVSVSRFSGRNHFISDVVIGSAIGYGIGRYVYRTNHDRSLDSPSGQAVPRQRSKLFPSIAPRYDRHERSYGLMLAWNL